jgi:hypothetical protein
MRNLKSISHILFAGAAVAAAGIAIVCALPAQNSGDALAAAFRNPPDSAKPRVWWHWMNGNVTKEGIQADLEWMKRVGIGGFQNFDAGLQMPQIVEKRIVFGTPEWKDAFRYATTLADSLGLEMGVAASPGWSESGGPWVTPAQAMKKYVWSEVRVEGGQPLASPLPKPPSTTGAYQNQGGGRGGAAGAADPEFYADAAVIAWRAPEGESSMAELEPKVTSSGSAFTLAALSDGDLARSVPLPTAPVGQKAWIQFEFNRPVTVRGLTLIAGGGGGRGGGAGAGQNLESSDDGRDFRPVASVPAGVRTVAFPAATARFYRVTFLTPPPQPAAPARWGGRGGAPQAAGPAGPTGTPIAELVLHTGATVNRFQEKAGFAAATGLYAQPTPAVAPADAIRKQDVLDLTSRLRSDGTLDWTPPPGRWVILRIGYSLTGRRNSPAAPEATGLEVDKLNRAHVRSYFDQYLQIFQDTTGGLMGKRGLQYLVTDSWEAGVANWTDDMPAEFLRRRGYDMHPWLPVLAGRVVDSAEASDRFLWDFRQTLADLVAEYHYDELTALLKERGMGRYSESHETGRALIADGMDVKRTASIPMSAMWIDMPDMPRFSRQFDADVRESASTAHIYGQNLVAAESLTVERDLWSFAPETLKPTADRLLAMGLNRFVIHASVHQPSNDKIPGMNLGPAGQMFTRHETWAELAKPWTTYLARSSYLLQQGTFAADILYYYGEDSNITALFANNPPAIPAGYNFDYINAHALKNLVSAKDGALTTPSGMRYRLLALDPNSRHMSLPVLRKIRDLVNAGATVVGPKPLESPSLADDQSEFQAIADRLWNAANGSRVFAGATIADALAAMKATPDFEYSKPHPDTELMFVHRIVPDGDIYWVDNRQARSETLDLSFRQTGKAPALWRPDTGRTEPASYRVANGRTIVPLRLEANEALFVVFRGRATTPSRTVPVPVETALAKVEGAWEVAFQPDRGAPPQATFPSLLSWSESADTGIRYFSGTGTYSRSLEAPAAWFQKAARLVLDLGDVKNLAVVTVNGRQFDILWKAPFRVDVTDALKPGANAVEVKVTNLWANRLIGDEQPGVTKKYTYTAAWVRYSANSPLLPSGLLGPVRVLKSALP